ncbi:MAG: hypothetical protein ACXAEI_05345 [Candidatus Hodarchaeales archaeon]|jgi:hypothetical protein
MTTLNILKTALLLVGLGFFLLIGLQTVAGTSSWDDPVSTVNSWMMGDGDESHHMMGHHDSEHDDDYHEEHHGNEDHEGHHESMHDDEFHDEVGDCHRP